MLWRGDWRRFLEALDVPVEPEDSEDLESLEDWIEQAVDAFCAQKNYAQRRARPSFRTSSRSYGSCSRTDANGAVGRQLVDENS